MKGNYHDGLNLAQLVDPGMVAENGKLDLQNGVEAIHSIRHSGERLVFNICGAKYEILESTFQRYPNTLLADHDRRAQFWDEERKEFYLDRNRSCFKAALTFYQSHGILVRPEGIPENLFFQEMEFYGIRKRKPKRERPMPNHKLQKQVWCLFEYPDTSNGARVIAWFSCSVVLLSIALFCVETLPKFQSEFHEGQRVKTKQEVIFYIIEAACIAWFTIEYLVRFISSPCKRQFVVGALNIIDLVAILPFFISLGLENQDSDLSSMAVVRAVRLVRVFRIFKLSRYSKGLQILGKTLKASLTELGLLSFFLAVGVVLFASAIYYAEIEENKEVFSSIPQSFWWAIVTMTTVGYGDMFPITVGGRVVGSLCAFTGILAIALPVPVIVANFEHFYNQNESEGCTMENNGKSRYERMKRFFENIRKKRHPNEQMQDV